MSYCELPPLYARGKKNDIIVWTVAADNDILVASHGKHGGKLVSHRVRCLPTNVGRSNERDGTAQAVFEAQAAWDKKVKEGYFETVEAASSTQVYLPMLAHPLYKRKAGQIVGERKVPWSDGVFAQPKLNGLRCLTFIEDSGIRFVSREGTVWSRMDHLRTKLEELKQYLPTGSILDGEIYIHGVPLQTLGSLVHDYRAESAALQYHVYDFPSISAGFEERTANLQLALQNEDAKRGGMIHLVATHEVRSKQEAEVLEKQYVSRGYEGLIIRRRGVNYAWANRTDALIKIKQFIDEEFQILDVVPREYWPPGSLTPRTIVDKFVYQNNTTVGTFESVPNGSMAQREAWWSARSALVGRLGTVRYYERSVADIPQGNPTTVAIRLSEDLPAPDQNMWDS